MTRSEFVRRLVLNWISDDFENVDQVILPHVAQDGIECGLTIGRAEVVDALAGLVQDGLAKAYILPGPAKDDPFSGELPVMPEIEVVEENFKTYFFITEKGMKAHLSDDAWWPFDDDGNRRLDWHLDIT